MLRQKEALPNLELLSHSSAAPTSPGPDMHIKSVLWPWRSYRKKHFTAHCQWQEWRGLEARDTQKGSNVSVLGYHSNSRAPWTSPSQSTLEGRLCIVCRDIENIDTLVLCLWPPQLYPLDPCSHKWHGELAPFVTEEFMNPKHWVVHRTTNTFSAMPGDQAHEQNNELVKGSGGAVRLTENPAALRKWMLARPEQARLLKELEDWSSMGNGDHFHHEADLSTQEKLKDQVMNICNTMSEMASFTSSGIGIVWLIYVWLLARGSTIWTST